MNTYKDITIIFLSKLYSFFNESVESTPGRVLSVRVNITVNGAFAQIFSLIVMIHLIQFHFLSHNNRDYPSQFHHDPDQ